MFDLSPSFLIDEILDTGLNETDHESRWPRETLLVLQEHMTDYYVNLLNCSTDIFS